MAKLYGQSWREQRTASDPHCPPGILVRFGTRDPKCAGSWWIDSAGKRRGMKMHRCSIACTWTLAEALAALQEQPIHTVGAASFVPRLVAKTDATRGAEARDVVRVA